MENNNDAPRQYPIPTLEKSYWYHKLEDFLKVNNMPLVFSLDVQDKWIDFLNARSTMALQEYDLAMSAGASHQGAHEIALAMLYLNINFSAQELIEEYLDNHFPQYYQVMVKKETLQTWLTDLEGYCKSLFEKFATEQQDLDLSEDNQELIAKIAEYLVVNKENILD